MIEKPKFKDGFHVEVLETDHVFLLRETRHNVLTGAKYKLIAPLLNGENTVLDIAAKLEGQIALPVIQYMLNQMEAQGLIVEGDTSASPETLSYFYSMNVDAVQALDQLNHTSIMITALGQVDAASLHTALEQEGIRVTDAGGDVRVVVVDDYLNPALAAINQEALEAGQSWVLVKLVGGKSWIGPLFQPNESPCWECLAQRIRNNRQAESFLERVKPQDGAVITSFAALPSTLEVAANLTVTEIVKWLAQGKSQLENTILTFDHLALKLERHTVVRRPQCPVCGDPSMESKPEPIRLVHEKLTGSGFRTRHAEQTFRHLEHHISPISGIITGLNDVTEDLNGLTYTYAAGHYFPMITDSVFWLKQNLKSITGGKGTSQINAKVGAISEAIERYSTVFWGTEPVVRGSYQSLGDCAIHPYASLGFSRNQYQMRLAGNRQSNKYSYGFVPNPFDETRDLAWSPMWSLTDQEFKYVLATICYYGHPESPFFFNTFDSNGVAAGNTLEEAILQGFGELIERDSVAIWWYNRVTRPGVDLDSFNLPYLASLTTYYQQLNREFWVLDITSDLGIPAFAAVSRRCDSALEDIIYGFGAHLNPQVAIMQAVTEMNQTLPAVKAKPDGTTDYRWHQQDAIDWWKTATISNQPYLVPDRAIPPKRLSDYPSIERESLKEYVEWCQQVVERAGMEMLVLDMTRPDIDMSVCRVMVPGLRHFWRRLAPGRLYDVPVALGWLDQPRSEDDLNPYSIFF